MTAPFRFLNPPIRREFIGFGAVITATNTSARMRSLIRAGSTNEYVRKWAEKIVEGVADRNHHGEIQAIYDFLQGHTRYANDPRGTEYIQTPDYVLKRIEMGDKPSLDCDDYTVAALSLARVLGYDTRIRLTGYDADKTFSHVYGLVKIDGVWTPIDCVRKDTELGWQAPNPTIVKDLQV